MQKKVNSIFICHFLPTKILDFRLVRINFLVCIGLNLLFLAFLAKQQFCLFAEKNFMEDVPRQMISYHGLYLRRKCLRQNVLSFYCTQRRVVCQRLPFLPLWTSKPDFHSLIAPAASWRTSLPHSHCHLRIFLRVRIFLFQIEIEVGQMD
jgi:hypothetical protein